MHTKTKGRHSVLNRTIAVVLVLAAGYFGRIVSSANAAQCVTAPSGMKGWWRAEGNATDANGRTGNDGELGGNTAYAPGKVGPAFIFDGNGDGIHVGNPRNLQLQNFTIAAWVERSSATQVSATSSFGEIVGYGPNGYVVGFLSDGHLFLSKNGVDFISSALALTDTACRHVAVTKTGNQVVFYIDGALDVTRTYNTTFSFTSDLVIGAVNNTFDGSFLGLIDELQ